MDSSNDEASEIASESGNNYDDESFAESLASEESKAVPDPVKLKNVKEYLDDYEEDYEEEEYVTADKADNEEYSDEFFENTSQRSKSNSDRVSNEPLSLHKQTSPENALFSLGQLGTHTQNVKSGPTMASHVALQQSAHLAKLHAILQDDSATNSNLSLLLRKLESKYHDEIEELREKNALYIWRERELKQTLRLHKEGQKFRKAKLEKKRKRAIDRRREHENLLEKFKLQLSEKESQIEELQNNANHLTHQSQVHQNRIEKLTDHVQRLEERNLALSDSLQLALANLHASNLKFESAVNEKLIAEKRNEEISNQHNIELRVLEHKLELDTNALRRALEKEAQGRIAERENLPEIHRVVLETQRLRNEHLEQELIEKRKEILSYSEAQTKKHDKEMSAALEKAKFAEERAERKVSQELEKISRERDSLDAQRRELLITIATTNARYDEERGRMEALRAQIEVKQFKHAHEQADLQAKSQLAEERSARMEEEAANIETRKQDLMHLGRKTLEKSRIVSQQLQKHAELEKEVKMLRERESLIEEKAIDIAKKTHEIQVQKATIEKVALELQKERLLIAKQRVESRYIFDGTRKLDSLLRQQQMYTFFKSTSSAKVPASYAKEGMKLQ